MVSHQHTRYEAEEKDRSLRVPQTPGIQYYGPVLEQSMLRRFRLGGAAHKFWFKLATNCKSVVICIYHILPSHFDSIAAPLIPTISVDFRALTFMKLSPMTTCGLRAPTYHLNNLSVENYHDYCAARDCPE